MNSKNRFKDWKKKSAKPKEQISYQAFMDDNDNFVCLYDSFADMASDCEVNINNGTWQKRPYSEGNDDWIFGKDFPDEKSTTTALVQGRSLPKYLDMVDKAKDDLYSKYPELIELQDLAIRKRKRRKFSEDGGELDIDKYMSGETEMWQSTQRHDVRKKTATIYVDVCASCGNTYKQFLKTMVWSIAMADIVSSAGIALQIIVGATASKFTDDQNQGCYAVMAKKADEPLDISRMLTYGISGFFRHYILYLLCCNITNGEAYDNGGSIVGNIHLNEPAKFFETDILIGSADDFNQDKMVSTCIAGINKLFNQHVEVE